MFWFVMLGVMFYILAIACLRKSGESYSAGQGMFKNSDGYIEEGREEFSDYNPYEYDSILK